MNKPQTEYVLVRTPRVDDLPVTVSILHKYGEGFDFSNHSWLETKEPSAHMSAPMEEWVPTEELEMYKQARAKWKTENS